MTIKFSIVTAPVTLNIFAEAMDIRDFDFRQVAVVEFRLCTST